MDNISGKGISRIPLIILALALYAGYKTFFHANKAHIIYQIATPEHDTLQVEQDTTRVVVNKEWAAITPSREPMVIKAVQNSKTTFSFKPVIAYSPKVVPQEEVVKNLLEQGESLKDIARQTRFTKKEIRKIRRKKKAEERKDKKQRKKASLAKQ